MTSVTMQLPDDLIQKAKKAGVFNESTMADVLSQFLSSQIAKKQTVQNKEGLSIEEVAGSLKSKTNISLTVEEMNSSVAEMFADWKC